MPVEIPLSPAGERFVTVNVGTQVLLFRTYFVCGQDRHWLLDIRDAQNKPLFSGINLVPGVDNLLKGRGDVLHDCQLRVRLAVPAAGREAFYGKRMIRADNVAGIQAVCGNGKSFGCAGKQLRAYLVRPW